MLRPSYVLSGAAMNVALNDEELDQYLKDAMIVSKDYPVVISRYILDAQVCYFDTYFLSAIDISSVTESLIAITRLARLLYYLVALEN